MKYWRRRAIVVDRSNKTCRLLKLYYLLWIKCVDAHHNASMGTSLNAGAQFITLPHFPHRLNGIIVGHDAIIGRECTIFQHVTIAHGGLRIGDKVLIGAGAKILPHVTIGNNVRIGANTVVNKSFSEDNILLAGVPAKIVKRYHNILDNSLWQNDSTFGHILCRKKR